MQAPGYGAVKFSRSFAAGEVAAVNIAMPSNWASSTHGATASGDGTTPANLINDTESTLWESTVAPVANKQVTVDLSGTLARNVIRVQVFTSQPVVSNGPTAVRVVSLTARRAAPGVVVRWRTASEAGIAGFNVWRAGTKVNSALIPAKRVSGATYRLVDRTARPRVTYTYRLQAVTRDGSRLWFGRATARAGR